MERKTTDGMDGVLTMSRFHADVLDAAIMARVTVKRSLTPKGLVFNCFTTADVGSRLLQLELGKQVYLHRDSSAGRRMGGLPLPDGSSVTLIALRGAETC